MIVHMGFAGPFFMLGCAIANASVKPPKTGALRGPLKKAIESPVGEKLGRSTRSLVERRVAEEPSGAVRIRSFMPWAVFTTHATCWPSDDMQADSIARSDGGFTGSQSTKADAPFNLYRFVVEPGFRSARESGNLRPTGFI
jgi:hypothetical protein